MLPDLRLIAETRSGRNSQAIAYKAQGYQFAGGTVQLRSGLTGTPMD